MRNKNMSIRGALVCDMIHGIVEMSPGKSIQTGELKRDPVEPAWVYSSGYEYEIIDRKSFKVEYPKPEGVVIGRVVLQFRGSGHIGPMKNIYRKFSVRYSRPNHSGDALTMDYRVAPEHPYPAVLEDIIHAYQWLVEKKHYRPGQVMVADDPAGGGLVLALRLFLRDHGMSQPVGLVLMSPWVDLIHSGDSCEFNFEHNPLFGGSREGTLYNSSYVGGSGLRDPYISSVFGDFRGLPPALLQAGSHEMFLSDTLEMVQNTRGVGVKRRVSVYEGMFRMFQMSMGLIPKSREAWDEVARFMQIVYKIDGRPAGQIVKKIKRRRWRLNQY